VVHETTLFPSRSAARGFLLGAALFWGAFLVFGLFAPFSAGRRASSSPWLIAPALAALVGLLLVRRGQRALHKQLTGRDDRHPSLRTQIRSTLPSTLRAAASECDLNPMFVVVGLYSVLAAEVITAIVRGF
jgi:hypothetical protein